MKPTERSTEELFAHTSKCFFEKNGYYPTEKEAIILTEEAKRATMPELYENSKLATEDSCENETCTTDSKKHERG